MFLTLYFASCSKVRLSHFPPTAKGSVRQTVMSWLAFGIPEIVKLAAFMFVFQMEKHF